jgi:hypothetical protein
MKIIAAQNHRNESMIEFVVDVVHHYESPGQFYKNAIRELFRETESDVLIDWYLSIADQRPRTATEIRSAVAVALEMTPMPDFCPELDDIVSAYAFRTDWNAEEYVWRSGQQYWLLCWGTSA